MPRFGQKSRVYLLGGLLLGCFLLVGIIHADDLASRFFGAGSTLLTPASGPSSLITLPDWRGTDPVNVLVLGIDQREDERAQGVPTRSDTVMVASLNPVNKTATL